MAREFSRADRIRKALIREISDVIATVVKDPLMADKIISVIFQPRRELAIGDYEAKYRVIYRI